MKTTAVKITNTMRFKDGNVAWRRRESLSTLRSPSELTATKYGISPEDIARNIVIEQIMQRHPTDIRAGSRQYIKVEIFDKKGHVSNSVFGDHCGYLINKNGHAAMMLHYQPGFWDHMNQRDELHEIVIDPAAFDNQVTVSGDDHESGQSFTSLLIDKTLLPRFLSKK